MPAESPLMQSLWRHLRPGKIRAYHALPVYLNLLLNICGLPEAYLAVWDPRARAWASRECAPDVRWAGSGAPWRYYHWRLGLLVSWLGDLSVQEGPQIERLTAREAFGWCLLIAVDPTMPQAREAADRINAWPVEVARPWRYVAAGLMPNDLTALAEPPSADALLTLAALRGVALPDVDIFAA